MRRRALAGGTRAIFIGAGLSLGVAASFAACGGDDTIVGPGAGGQGAEGGGGEGGNDVNCVIDGIVSETEICDDGNMVSGDGCEPDCSWTCTKGTVVGDNVCDDTDPCNGIETCAEDHTCTPGTPVDDGTACGDGKVCKAGVCGDDVCGDLFVSGGEDCDDGNVIDGDGCDSDCTFSCESSDPFACTPVDICEGQGTCDDSTHTCTPGTPLGDDTSCGANSFCKGGVCTPAGCPNGVIDPGEDCDDNNVIDGDGCDADCTFSCVTPATDCPAPSPCQMAQCDTMHVCEEVADASQDGTVCGSNLVCSNGACIAPTSVCGNGVLETGEQCDFGAGNGPNTGCKANCTFSCTMAPDSCPDANSCNGVETCGIVTVNGQTGQACSPGTPLPACTSCTGGLCNNNTCQPSSCGDGCVDASQGEQCDPPNGTTCSTTCTTIVCGNGVREGAEQCDDGNLANNDGCDASCKFEQVDRIGYLKMQWNTDMFCTANALGGAITGSTAKSELQSSLDGGIGDGSINVIVKMLGLDDLTGTSDPSVQLGVVNGNPETMIGPAYNGNSDLDWWYYLDPASVGMNGIPTAQLPGSIVAKQLNAGPGTIAMALNLGGSPATLDMSNVILSVTLGATSAPLTTLANPPGHLPSENLNPALVSYHNGGQKTTNGAGKLCGNISAASLAQVPIPSSLVGGGLFSCSQNYTASNSLLDAIVGGCTVFFTPQIASTQPDTHHPGVAPVGAGPPYVLQTNASKVVTTCRDSNNQVVNLQACLNDAAYSSFFLFATGRVILK